MFWVNLVNFHPLQCRPYILQYIPPTKSETIFPTMGDHFISLVNLYPEFIFTTNQSDWIRLYSQPHAWGNPYNFHPLQFGGRGVGPTSLPQIQIPYSLPWETTSIPIKPPDFIFTFNQIEPTTSCLIGIPQPQPQHKCNDIFATIQFKITLKSISITVICNTSSHTKFHTTAKSIPI